MFERNKIETGSVPAGGTAVGVPVEITLADGSTLEGKVLLAQGRSIWDLLNGPSSFMEVEPYVGERMYLAKGAIRGLRLMPIPGAGHLQGRLRELDGFDPFGVLGLKRDASFEDIRAAYHRMAKLYHPDRYESAGLPQEVRDYLSAVARRVNVAFASLERAHQSARDKPAYQPSTPVYTSPGRI